MTLSAEPPRMGLHCIVAASMLGIILGATQTWGAAGHAVAVAVDSFADHGPTEGLEPEVLDFRYRPTRWQACIGLPDDPFKTIVGNDGGLYYDYGVRGPELYNNGQGVFGTRFLAGFRGQGDPGDVEQHLVDPRTPIAVTQQSFGDWTIQQRVWSAAGTESTGPDRWADRVDYLWITATNGGSAKSKAELTLDVGTTTPLELNGAGTRLFRKNKNRDVLCRMSVPCLPLTVASGIAGKTSTSPIKTASVITVSRNWARPSVKCPPCFRHVMVGFSQPLRFTLEGATKGKYRVYFGLIEGYHEQPGIRPVELRVEGRKIATLDLVAKPGRNVPILYSVTAADQDGDGKITFGIWAPASASDKNTILSGLWIYPESKAPSAAEVLAGTTATKPLAYIDADHLPASAAPVLLRWDLSDLMPGQSRDVVVTIPQGDWAKVTMPPTDAAAQYQRAVDYWRHVDLPYDRITVPDPQVQGLLDSCIRNIYQAREIKNGRPAFQVGPTCYRGTWAADGPFILEAITYLGRWRETRAGIEAQVDADTGPGGVAFSKKSGLRLWMILRHAQLTGDTTWLQKIWPRVTREVNQIIAYRAMTRSDPKQANFGLMPIGFGDGGLGGKHREYTNVYWTLAGLKSALTMARWLDKPELAKWQAEYADYWKTFDKARRRDQLVDAAGNTYVPVTMKGEQPQLPQRGAWAFLQSVFPGRIFEQDDPLMLGTMAMLDANQREGLIYGTGWIPDGIWNYAGSFYAHAHLQLGHGRKAAATLYAFANHASPMLCWREEQNVKGAPEHFVGDMPHNWASAEFIRLVRHLLVLERGDALHLFEGLPHAWVRPGGHLALKQIPTSFGPVSVGMDVDDRGAAATIVVTPPPHGSLKQIVVHLERLTGAKPRVQIDNQPAHALPVATSVRGPIRLIVPLKNEP